MDSESKEDELPHQKSKRPYNIATGNTGTRVPAKTLPLTAITTGTSEIILLMV
jgi:hypothetical protein